MSPLDSILGLEGLFIEQVQRAHDIHVWARPRKRACCVYCANPRVRIKATYTRTLKHTRQGNQLMWLHLRVPKYHCLQCNRYFRHRIAGVRPRLRATEGMWLEEAVHRPAKFLKGCVSRWKCVAVSWILTVRFH